MNFNKEELEKILPSNGPKLEEVIKYIKKYEEDKIVIKLGGSCLESKELFSQFIDDICVIYKLKLNIIVVHGGGKSIEKKFRENNIESKWINGLRVSDEKSIQFIEEALNELNIKINEKLREKGCESKGITAKDQIVKVDPISKDLQYVGSPKTIENNLLINILNNNEIPIIAPLGIGDDKKIYNVNADHVSGKIAKSLNARRLLLMTDVAGVMKDQNLITELSSNEALKMIEDGTIKDGFVPKIHTCIDALENVKAVAIIDGRKPHSILFELFSDKGAGTLLRK